MKLLVLDAAHCLSLALVREAVRRQDLELELEQAYSVTAEHLEASMPYAVVIPPLAQPLDEQPAAIKAHVANVEACLEACLAQDVPLVWCVSDQLYEDGFDTPIDEHVIPAPRNEGLKQLIRVGDRIRAELPHHLMVRLGPLFALDGQHAWLGKLLDTLTEGGELRAASDIIFCPTSADSVAMALIGMLQQQSCGAQAWGSYHLAGTEPVSAYTFVSMVRTQLETRLEGRGEHVELGVVKALNHHHEHPLRRVLNCRRVLGSFGVHQKPWRLEVGRMLDLWCLARDEQQSDQQAQQNKVAQ